MIRLPKRLALCALCVLVPVVAPGQAQPPRTTAMTSTAAHDYITSFRRGETFKRPAKGLLADGRIGPDALEILGIELASGSASVRENLVDLLVDASLQADPLTRRGAEVVRDPRVIELLAGAGLSKVDVGRNAAMDALRKLVMVPDLAPFGPAFVKALDEAPTTEGLLLVAKAKPPGAKAVVDRLAALPAFAPPRESTQVARAALGAQGVEDGFIAAVAAATDGPALAQAVGTLGLIGTQRSLEVVALQLRTPLTIHKVGAFEKSVRLNVLEALLYNFPDRPELYPNNIVRAEDYTAAEAFCTSVIGVRYTTPAPPFMTYRGYPIPRR